MTEIPANSRVIKCIVPVYVYMDEAGVVSRVIVWDGLLKAKSLHVYAEDHLSDDAGEVLGWQDVAHEAMEAANWDTAPGWDFM